MDEYKSHKGKDTDHQIADVNYRRYIRARDNGHTDFVETKRRCTDFYVGDQWEEAVRATLEAEGRPALTINKILSTVNTVLGEQLSRRASFQAKLKRDASHEQAKVISKLLMHVAESNDLEYSESEVFRDGVIGGRGYFDARMCFKNNIHGEVSIKHKNAEEVLLNPDDNEYDPSTWREVITTAWQSLDEIETMYGKKAMRQVKEIANDGEYYSDDSIVFEDRADTFGGGDRIDHQELDAEDEKNIRGIRVISRQYKKMKMCHYFIDQVNGDMRPIPEGWGDKRIEFTLQAFNLGKLSKPETAIRWTTTADRIVLSDIWSPYRSYTIVPYFCYWVAGRPFGIVSNLISPQEQLNKVSSQELHIVNSTANSGWIYESGSILSHTDDEMAAQGSKTGLIVTYSKNAKNPPTKIQPNTIPTGIDRVAKDSANNIKEISGVTDALLGLESAEVSGVALKSKENRGQVQIQIPIDNLARTRKILGKKILELVQDFYTEPRLLYITDEHEVGQPPEEMQINTITPAGMVLNDVTRGEYDVVVTTQPARDGYQDTQFAEMLEMRNAGVMVPAYRVVKNSHLANKDDVAEEVREMEGLGQQTPEEQQLAQLQMQTTMQGMQLEVQKLSAEIQKLNSAAVLDKAKAEDLARSDDMELAGMDHELQKEREGNELRRDLATLSAASSLDNQVLATKGRIAEEKVKAQLAPKEVSGASAKKTPAKPASKKSKKPKKPKK